MRIVVVAGRQLEDTQVLMERLGIARITVGRMVKRGMPQSIKLGRHRYYDRRLVDDWLLGNEPLLSTGERT